MMKINTSQTSSGPVINGNASEQISSADCKYSSADTEIGFYIYN